MTHMLTNLCMEAMRDSYNSLKSAGFVPGSKLRQNRERSGEHFRRSKFLGLPPPVKDFVADLWFAKCATFEVAASRQFEETCRSQ